MIEMKIAYIRHGKIKLIVFAVLLALLGLFALHSAGRSAALNDIARRVCQIADLLHR